MYQVAVRRSFIARHFLIGGDWGDENRKHAHDYVAEAVFEGDRLDPHGYLVDIVALEAALDASVAAHRDRLLNDLPAFAGLNPSLEHFCRIMADELAARLHAETVRAVTVRLWENDIAWAAYRRELTAGG